MPENDTKNTGAVNTNSNANSDLKSPLASTNQRAIGGGALSGARSSGSLFRLGPNITLVVLVVVAALTGLVLLQLETVHQVHFWLAIVFFAWMVWRRSSLALACLFVVLGSLLATKSFFHSGYRVWESLHNIYPHDILSTLLVLVFAGACFRYLETKKYCTGVLSKFGWRRGLQEQKSGQRRKEFPSLLGGRWWLIPVSVVSAVLLLEFFPFDHTAVQKYWIQARPMRLIFIIGTLFLVWFLIRSLFMLIMRWKMDVNQAGVHTRAVIAREFWREHKAIEMRRTKALLKKRH